MIFDQPPAELPVATLRPRETGAQLMLDARRWLASRWRWLKPRWIPVAAAFAGMIAVLASAAYLRDLAHQPPERLPAPTLTLTRAEGHVAKLRAEAHAPAARMFVVKPVLTPAPVPSPALHSAR